jgi:hypothetical protein
MAFTRKEPSRYRSQAPDSAIEAAEFSFAGGQHYCFFTLRNSADSKGFIAKLHAPPLAQEVISSTKTGTGELLVTRGALAPQATLQALSGMGEHLTPILPPSKKFDPWVWRGITSLVGQSLTLTSGLLAAEKGADRNALFGFAGLNLLANICNITFGAQEKPDPAQLRLLKQKVNQDVLAAGGNETSLPGIDDDRLALRPPEPRTFGQRSYDFLQKYSVSGGEIGLRTIGAASLAFPLKPPDKRKDGGFPFGPNDNPVTYKAGWATLAGKFISFASVEPDPYNPEPPSLIRQLRERVTFPLSSIVEMVAAGFMAHDRYYNKKITWGGKTMRDYPAAIGNAVFVGGYLIRLAAPYGSREVKIPELAAHIADSLATLPPEKITAQLAETCHMLARHFAGKQGVSLSQIYTLVTDELDRQHHIRLPAVAGGEKSAPHASPPPPSVTATKVQQIAHEGRAEHQAAAALHPH